MAQGFVLDLDEANVLPVVRIEHDAEHELLSGESAEGAPACYLLTEVEGEGAQRGYPAVIDHLFASEGVGTFGGDGARRINGNVNVNGNRNDTRVRLATIRFATLRGFATTITVLLSF